MTGVAMTRPIDSSAGHALLRVAAEHNKTQAFRVSFRSLGFIKELLMLNFETMDQLQTVTNSDPMQVESESIPMAKAIPQSSSSWCPKPKKGILKGQKKVRFNISATGIYGNNKTASEIHSQWYTKEDILKFKDKALSCARALMKESEHVVKTYIERTVSTSANQMPGHFTGIKYICGIEHLLCRAVCGMLLSTRSESILAVMEEQKRQREQGVKNPGLIARVYMEKTLFCRVWRHRIAVLNCQE